MISPMLWCSLLYNYNPLQIALSAVLDHVNLIIIHYYYYYCKYCANLKKSIKHKLISKIVTGSERTHLPRTQQEDTLFTITR